MKLFIISFLTLFTSIFTSLSQEIDLKGSMERGQTIYQDFCMSCHLENGEGVEEVYPPLAKSDYLINFREASIRGIKYGQQGEIRVNGVIYNNTMMPMGLTDEEVADVMNFISNSWGNTSKSTITVSEVAAITR